MDSRIGLDYIVENKEYTAKLGSGVKFLYFLFFSGTKFETYNGVFNFCTFQNLQTCCCWWSAVFCPLTAKICTICLTGIFTLQIKCTSSTNILTSVLNIWCVCMHAMNMLQL